MHFKKTSVYSGLLVRQGNIICWSTYLGSLTLHFRNLGWSFI